MFGQEHILAVKIDVFCVRTHFSVQGEGGKLLNPFVHRSSFLSVFSGIYPPVFCFYSIFSDGKVNANRFGFIICYGNFSDTVAILFRMWYTDDEHEKMGVYV